MSGCPTRDQLNMYLDERLPSDERMWLEGHVSACRSCQQALEEAAAQVGQAHLQALRAPIHSPHEEPKADVLMRIERAGWQRESKSDVIVGPTGPYHSPAGPIPGMSSAVELAGQPTVLRPGPSPDGDAEMVLPPGTILGQYRILEPLGAGGMGQVYKAVHEAMDRVVALKVIAPHLLKEARARARFQQEVRTAARLHHPNIVLAHDAAEANGLWFLVMEYVEGTTLSTLVAEHGLPPVPLACEIIRQAAMGLQHAQDKGMVHRDIKPGNLMVSAQHTPGGGAIVRPDRRGPGLPGWPTAPFVKILDFGVARLREIGSDGEPLKAKTLTQEGSVVGTPEFMSPEQACDSRSVDVRSDIYSLGCTLYFLLAGRPPFCGATALETMVQHLKQPLPPLDQMRPGLAPALVEIVNKMLAKSADDRYRTPAEVAEALRPWIGEFASSVAPDVRLEQRGLSATAPSAPQLISSPDGPRPDSKLKDELNRFLQKPPPSSNAHTYVALALLFLVSMIAFWIVFSFFEHKEIADTDEPPGHAKQPQTNVLGMRMQRVERGEFHRTFAPPDLNTRFPYDLDVAATEVTRGQFARFVRETNYKTLAEKTEVEPRGSFVPSAEGGGKWVESMTWKNGGDGDNLPVACVAWEDAIAFCNWLSRLEKLEPCYVRSGNQWVWRDELDGYRLPTEAEWENAARADSKRLLPAEDAALYQFAWLRSSPVSRPHPVEGLTPNARALHDLWGNVWEWCWDWYVDVPKDANGPASGTKRAVWGGGWNETPAELAKKPRKGLPPTYRATDVGFRVVRRVTER